MKSSLRSFFTGFSVPLLLLTSYCLLSAQILIHSGEYLTIPETVGRISSTGGYYGSALSQRTFYFKKNLYQAAHPEIATLGSSRVLQFQHIQFSKSFVNLGGMGTLDDVLDMAHQTFDLNPPKILILGIDAWWFHPQAEKAKPVRGPELVKIDLADILQPAAWLSAGKISWRQVKDLLLSPSKHAGIAAALRQDGFDRYGSYHYTSTWNGTQKTDEIHFNASRSRIEKGIGVFVHGSEISKIQLQKLSKLLDFLKSKNVHVIAFLPPFAPSMVDLMQSNKNYSYMQEAQENLRFIIKSKKIPFFNYHDVRFIGSNDCEFTDGIHGGQIVYHRILKNMSEHDAILRKSISVLSLEKEIEIFKGHASTLINETDFIKLGCSK